MDFDQKLNFKILLLWEVMVNLLKAPKQAGYFVGFLESFETEQEHAQTFLIRSSEKVNLL
jgi:hypothetical protein